METPTVPPLIAWAAVFPPADVLSAARLRHQPGVRAAWAAEKLWLRGERCDDGLRRLLDSAAPTALYRCDASGRLTLTENLLPTADLPTATWTPLAELLTLALPPALTPARVAAPVRLGVVRSAAERPASALRLSFDALVDWCETAPAVRLERLRFSVDYGSGEAFVFGTPLPPLPGVLLHGADGVLVPCGFTLEPAVDAPSARAVLRLTDGDVAVFDEAGWSRVPADRISALNRSSVRILRSERHA